VLRPSAGASGLRPPSPYIRRGKKSKIRNRKSEDPAPLAELPAAAADLGECRKRHKTGKAGFRPLAGKLVRRGGKHGL